MKKFLHKNNNMKRIILIFLGLFSLAYAQYSPTSAKTRFVNGISIGTKLDGSFNSADSNAIYWRADSVVMAKYKGTARALSFIDDTAFLTNRFVRLQTGNLYRQTGKMWISDTIRTSGFILGSNLLTVSTSSAQALSGNNTSTGRGLFAQAVGNNAAMLSNTSNDSSAVRIVNNGNAEIASFENSFGDVAAISNDGGLQQFNSGFWGRTLPTTLSGNRTYLLPNASGTIALTSNVTDSAAALRASINTKLNISDTAAMLSGYARSGQFVPYTGAVDDVNLGNNNFTARSVTGSGNISGGQVGVFYNSNSAGSGVSIIAGSNGGHKPLLIQDYLSTDSLFVIRGNGTGYAKGKFNFADSIVGVNQRLTGTLNGTTVSMTGGYTSTTTGSDVLVATTATTSQKAARIANTSGDGAFGIESSAGNSIFLGASPYTTVIGSLANRSLHLGSNNTVYATLDSIGRFSVGTKSASATLDVVGTSELNGATTIKAGNGNQLILDNAGERFTQLSVLNNGSQKAEQFWDNTNNFYQLASSNSGSTVRIVAQTNGVELANGATSFSAISDERMKVIKRPIENATSKLNSYRSVIGRYKSDSTDVERAFLIAQDVQKNYPYAITVSKDSMNTLRLSYTELIPLLIKGFQEQSAKVSELEARVAKLEELIKLIKP